MIPIYKIPMKASSIKTPRIFKKATSGEILPAPRILRQWGYVFTIFLYNGIVAYFSDSLYHFKAVSLTKINL
jgi:hypothetical protein